MKQHKWHKEIKAWADGAEIEFWNDERETWSSIFVGSQPRWYEDVKYRIKPQPKEPQFEEYITPYADVNIIFKPQPKEPQYLYVYIGENNGYIFSRFHPSKYDNPECIGKIKLEENDK